MVLPSPARAVLLAALHVTALPLLAAQPLTITHADVPYGSDPAQRLDVYLVPSATPTPVLIEIHGGGWWSGKKSQFQNYFQDAGGIGIVERAAQKGISIVSINYRLVDASGPAVVNTFPTPNFDVVRAVQFVRSNAGAWNIDPDRIGLLGNSAGSHLALWTALSQDFADPSSSDPVARESSRPATVINCHAPTEFAPPNGLLCSPSRIALCWYMGVTSPAQMASVPVATLQAASPTWLASGGAGPDKVREISLLNIYSGSPSLSSSSQVPSPTTDPHNILFSFLIKEALETVGHEDITLFHRPVLSQSQVELRQVTTDYLEDRMHRPLIFVSPDPSDVINPGSFAPKFRMNMNASAAQFLLDVAATPATDNVYLVFGSQTLFLPIGLAQIQQLVALGFFTVTTAGRNLTIDVRQFSLPQLGANPWIAALVVRNGKPYWSRRSY